jgi:hypothetical protein
VGDLESQSIGEGTPGTANETAHHPRVEDKRTKRDATGIKKSFFIARV